MRGNPAARRPALAVYGFPANSTSFIRGAAAQTGEEETVSMRHQQFTTASSPGDAVLGDQACHDHRVSAAKVRRYHRRIPCHQLTCAPERRYSSSSLSPFLVEVEPDAYLEEEVARQRPVDRRRSP